MGNGRKELTWAKQQSCGRRYQRQVFALPMLIKAELQYCKKGSQPTKPRKRNKNYASSITLKQGRLIYTATQQHSTLIRISLPAPQIPVGRRPQWIQSFFILWTNRSAVSSTLRVLSPNWRLWANRCMYRHGSALSNGRQCQQYTRNCHQISCSFYSTKQSDSIFIVSQF